MKAKFVNEKRGTEIYNKVVSKIIKTKNINEAYKMIPSLVEYIGDEYESAIRGAIEFYYDEFVQESWNGRPIEDYMQNFL